jgi:hypothetical protein
MWYEHEIRSQAEDFWELPGGCPGAGTLRVFRFTLQGYKSIDYRPLTII